jgi:predicted SAM-dependent methyltransferase
MEVAKYWIDSIEKSDTLVDETIKLNIGCNKNLLPGWINIDMIDYPGVIKHDLRERLPYANNTIEFVVSEHLIEHLTREEALRLLRDIYRCLQSGGVCRTSTPDLDILVKNYIDNNIHAYDNVGFTPRNRCEMMNIGMRGWEHKYLYNKEDLKLLFEEAGFTEFRFVLYRDSRYLELKNIEQREYTNEIICEAIK